MALEVWTAENDPRNETLLSLGVTAAGLVLAVALRDFRTIGTMGAVMGFSLGVMLFAIGLLGVAVSGRQRIVIDPEMRTITVEDALRVGTKTRVIRFDDVADVGVGYQGKRMNFVGFYFLVLKLTDGQTYPLFAPGRAYAGATDRSVVDGWCDRLKQYLRE